MLNLDLKVDDVSKLLANKSVALCITGGIAAIETPKIARQLRRYGADVTIYTTSQVFKFIGESALQWATGKTIISELGGLAEHIAHHDLILVAPATLNTINKIFAGIADNAVTTLIASALGKRMPLLIAPTMHESLYSNPILKQNLAKVKELGINIIPPRINEGKAKIAKTENIVAEVCRALSTHKLKNKKILVTGGPTPGKIDSVRVITNTFRGNLAVKLATELYMVGANVKLLLGKTGIHVLSYLDVEYHRDYHEYYDNVIKNLEQNYDIGIFSAAVADYIPKTFLEGKIPSGGLLTKIDLKPTKKVIAEVRKKFPKLYMVTFKFCIGKTKEELLNIARDRISKGYNIVVANRGEDMMKSHNAYIVDSNGIIAEPINKRDIAEKLIKIMGERI